MRLHVAVAGWTLEQEASGAKRRMLALLTEIGEQLQSGEQVSVLYRAGHLPENAPRSVEWVPIEIPGRPTWRRVLGERRLLRRTLDSLAANVLELGTLPVPPNLSTPVCLTIHDLRDLEGHGTRPAFLTRSVLRRSMRRVRAVVVPSRFTAERLREAMGGLTPPIHVIHSGCEEQLLHRTPTAPTAGERPFFLYVGHLERRKNLLLLLSAYAEFLDEVGGDPTTLPALRLVGADHGMASAIAERCALLEISGHVHVDGPVDDDHLYALYQQASALLFPSLHEGFGLPALEALAVGTPVFVSDRGALPEVVGSAGTVLPAEDARAWTDAMRRVVEQPSDQTAVQRRKGRAGEFGWNHAATQLLQVWRELN